MVKRILGLSILIAVAFIGACSGDAGESGKPVVPHSTSTTCCMGRSTTDNSLIFNSAHDTDPRCPPDAVILTANCPLNLLAW